VFLSALKESHNGVDGLIVGAILECIEKNKTSDEKGKSENYNGKIVQTDSGDQNCCTNHAKNSPFHHKIKPPSQLKLKRFVVPKEARTPPSD
jgi:hypothetical protein